MEGVSIDIVDFVGFPSIYNVGGNICQPCPSIAIAAHVACLSMAIVECAAFLSMAVVGRIGLRK